MRVELYDFKYKNRYFKHYIFEIPEVTIIGAFAEEAIAKLVAKSLDEFIEKSTIRLNVNADQCPYWDYKNHTASHTCNGCTCMESGNDIVSVTQGIKLGQDRYCLLGATIGHDIVKSVEENNNEERNNTN